MAPPPRDRFLPGPARRVIPSVTGMTRGRGSTPGALECRTEPVPGGRVPVEPDSPRCHQRLPREGPGSAFLRGVRAALGDLVRPRLMPPSRFVGMPGASQDPEVLHLSAGRCPPPREAPLLITGGVLGGPGQQDAAGEDLCGKSTRNFRISSCFSNRRRLHCKSPLRRWSSERNGHTRTVGRKHADVLLRDDRRVMVYTAPWRTDGLSVQRPRLPLR